MDDFRVKVLSVRVDVLAEDAIEERDICRSVDSVTGVGRMIVFGVARVEVRLLKCFDSLPGVFGRNEDLG